MILKNKILTSLVATMDNNIDSIDDLIRSKLKAIVLANTTHHIWLSNQKKKFKSQRSNQKHQIQFEAVEYEDVFSDKILIKILQGTHVLLYYENNLVHFDAMLNQEYPLHLSKSKKQLYLPGLIMRKSIDNTIERKIKRS